MVCKLFDVFRECKKSRHMDEKPLGLPPDYLRCQGHLVRGLLILISLRIHMVKDCMRNISTLVLLVCLFGGHPARAEVPKFDFQDLQGVRHSLSDYRGKWVVVNFWATWCPPCLEEIPDLVDFHEQHKDRDAVVIGVNYQRIESKRLTDFIDNFTITYPITRLPPDQASPFGSVQGLPTTFLVAPDGELVAMQVGQVSSDMIEAFMDRYQGPGPRSEPEGTVRP